MRNILVALAQTYNPNQYSNGTAPPSLGKILATAQSLYTNNITPIAGIVILVVLLWAGYLRLTAVDNPDQLKRSNSLLFWGFVGIAITLAAYLIVNVTVTLFNPGGIESL